MAVSIAINDRDLAPVVVRRGVGRIVTIRPMLWGRA